MTEHLQKLYVGPNNIVSLRCPNCGVTKTFKVDKFKGRKAPLNLRCKCQFVFKVFLEFRKAPRKKTHLEGHYVAVGGEGQQGAVVIQNVSRKGLGFTIEENHGLACGDEVLVDFALDDGKGSQIKKRVIVRSVEDLYVGCEFVDKEHVEEAFEAYLI